jgi:hypothetical protein
VLQQHRTEAKHARVCVGYYGAFDDADLVLEPERTR